MMDNHPAFPQKNHINHRGFQSLRSNSKTTGFSPFEIVLGQNPAGAPDLIPISRPGHSHPKAEDMAEYLQHIHEQVKQQIRRSVKVMISTTLESILISGSCFLE
ncbi:hypothetical protein Droror1_Dr00021105 [Drosera rotundifolia]